jgi:hypothetical protein
MQIRDRIKELRRVPASQLRPNPKNWRTHPQEQADALRGVLAEVGIADACIAREMPDGSLMLVDGHLRTETLGGELVPVLVLDVNEEEADKILATLDPLAGMAEQNNKKLSELFESLKQSGDILHTLTWPDYIIDPLLYADWNPPDPELLPDKQKQKENFHHISLTTEERKVITEAVNQYHKENPHEESLTFGECLVCICKQWAEAVDE